MEHFQKDQLTEKQERLNQVIDQVVTHLKDRRKRQILAADMMEALKDTEFYNDKIENAHRRLSNVEQELDRVRDQYCKLTAVLDEKVKASRKIKVEYENQREVEAELTRRRYELPKIKFEVKMLSAELKNTELELVRARKNEHLANAAIKQLEKELETLKKRRNSLITEISVSKNTRDLIMGFIPDGFDPFVFEKVAGDFEENLAKYRAEIKGGIEKVKREIRQHKADLAGMQSQHGSEMDGKEKLEQHLQSLLKMVGNKRDPEKVRAKVEQHNEQVERRMLDINAMEAEIAYEKKKLQQISGELEKEKKNHQRLKRKLSPLKELKMKMDAVDDLNAELASMDQSIAEARENSASMKRKSKILGNLEDEIAALNDSLRKAIEYHWNLLAGLDQSMESLGELQ